MNRKDSTLPEDKVIMRIRLRYDVQVKVKVKSLSPVQFFATAWTVAYQAPPSMEFSRQEYCSGLPFPFPGDLPTQGSNLGLPHCGQLLYHLSHQRI